MVIKNKEACVGDLNSALEAQELGATRIELCDNLYEGGTTQSLGVIKACSEQLTIPIQAIIRPRGGDFFYSDIEKEIMLYDLEQIKQFNINGVVVGSLNSDKSLDINFLKQFIQQSTNLKVAFHKAIDEIENPINEVKILEELGFSYILTSGTKETALQGVPILKEMLQASNKIKIIVAGGVTKNNLPEIHKLVNAEEYHGKKIVQN